MSIHHDEAARLVLQRAATHVLARGRWNADGRFGLRVTPDGLGTPPFGPDGTVVRIAGATLIREFRDASSPRTAAVAISGRTLAELADFAEVDLGTEFSAGGDTPPLGDINAPITLDESAASRVMAWHHLGAVALDSIAVVLQEPSVAQVWPEHFDLGIDAQTPSGRVNLGASPGDAFSSEPYLYVAPWEAGRPGDAAFWNAPFGAVVTRSAVGDMIERATGFFAAGLHHLSGA